MPTLTPQSRTDNIERSLSAYVTTEIQTGLGIRVWFQGQARAGSLPAQYIEASFVRLFPQTPIVRSGSDKRTARMAFLLNLNLYIQTDAIRSGALTRYSQATTEDNVSELFGPNAAIPIRDYAEVGTPVVGSLRSEEYPATVDVFVDANTQAGLKQRNISATLHYFSETTD